ncbi:MAG TPA: hypothetical protein VKX39_02280 [Bryobacteraceae bacterium]|jgi:hypothetical protein|nr:hypothetical protein [Bryobacteraceae bacterium]
MLIGSNAARPVNPEKFIIARTIETHSNREFSEQLSSAVKTVAEQFENGSQTGKTVASIGTAVLPAAQTAAPAQPATSSETPTDAYWASQPAAVQALRYAPDDQKGEMAQQLASEGYSIDVPIMVWGWDPLATMIQRQEEGYTWVPSALQPGVSVAPGVSMPGQDSYNPNRPPAGSIQVSTAFANGTNIAADPVAEMWLKGQSASS